MEIGFYQINADDTKDRLNLNQFNSGVFKDKNPAGYQNCTIDKPTLPPEKESSFTCASTTYYDLINSKIEIYGCLGESKKEEEFTYNYSIQYDNLQVNYTSSGILKYKTSNYKYLKDNIYRDIYYDINKVNPKISFKVTAENDILSSHGKAISQSVAIYPFDVFSSPVIITIINSKSQPVRQIKSRLANLYSTDMENVNYTNYPIYQAFESSSAYNISTEELNIEDLNDTNFKVITSFMPVCIANAKSSGTGPTFYLPNGSDSFNVTLEDVWIQPFCNFCLYFGLWDEEGNEYQKLEYDSTTTLYTYWFVNDTFTSERINRTFSIPANRKGAYVDYKGSSSEFVAHENTIDSIKIEEDSSTYKNYGHLGKLNISINYTKKNNLAQHKTKYNCVIGTQRHS